MTDWRAAGTAASALGSMGRASGWTASGLKGATFPPPSTEASCLSLSPVASCGSTSTGALCPSWRHAPHWYGPVIQPISKWVIAIWLVTQNLYVDWLVVEIAGRSTPPASIKASSESGEPGFAIRFFRFRNLFRHYQVLFPILRLSFAW